MSKELVQRIAYGPKWYFGVANAIRALNRSGYSYLKLRLKR